MAYYNIPVFIPELACPHRCNFCNQNAITGKVSIPNATEVDAIITEHLSTIDVKEHDVRIAFFGGSFTGISKELQSEYLQIAQKFLRKGVKGIRLSTRPDYIEKDHLQYLKSMGVTHIELGAQSLDDEVLKKAGRGHSVAAVEEASQLIRDANIVLGLQMMLGLPGDTEEKSMKTAEQIVALGAQETRIYPTLVIQDTTLERQWHTGRYHPLSLEDAVEQAARLYAYFEENAVKVLRVGLFAEDELIDGEAYLAGPFHRSFKELVISAIWKKKFNALPKNSNNTLKIEVSASDLNSAVGYKASNRKFLESKYQRVKFSINPELKKGAFRAYFL